ncbi:MAG: 50S ribosomal protein L21 [Gemmataceae bacterium]|nr:50S ribosomal protein L21 [Gemmataceae bacterium]
MYAIFEDGSRQYRVSVGDTLQLDHREVAVGSSLELNKVLLYSNGAEILIGQPVVAGARVIAEVSGHPTTKTVIQYFRRRKNYRRLKGHRQPYIEVRIKGILKAGE